MTDTRPLFADRADAGRRLAESLSDLRNDDTVVLGVPLGGIPVAAEVARALGAPLDALVVRKLGVPRFPDGAMGALGEDGTRVLNPGIFLRALVTPLDLASVTRREREILADRTVRLRDGRPRLDLRGRTAVVVDDGLVTGVSAEVACTMARAAGAERVVLAVPVAAREGLRFVRSADEIVTLAAPRAFPGVRPFYRDYPQVTEDEVAALLDDAAPERDLDIVSAHGTLEDVVIRADGIALHGRLHLPAGTRAVVVFAHGSGSGRHSPRNRLVASVLAEAGIGTLLLDLLSPVEEQDRHAVFDIPLLSSRLRAATEWLRSRPDTAGFRIGYFGASTGAGAALCAASSDPGIAAVVSRGGRADLAGERLADVRCPVLLIVGSRDPDVLMLNRRARASISGEAALEVVPGASHLFEEAGTLDRVAVLARDWFSRTLLQPESRHEPILS
ncbi:phosphoribosyltransferase family protein [Naasia sp. SYSU D00948]|uniref:phosphoribosyltransferase family protein n=1 Tax=Naasia sp. SYSU D00948 TaxID=2817379 RepID=UPI001B3052D0|nr:alpha/beta family hydrolase [Naasia sp. SYSU D00948]